MFVSNAETREVVRKFVVDENHHATAQWLRNMRWWSEHNGFKVQVLEGNLNA